MEQDKPKKLKKRERSWKRKKKRCITFPTLKCY